MWLAFVALMLFFWNIQNLLETENILFCIKFNIAINIKLTDTRSSSRLFRCDVIHRAYGYVSYIPWTLFIRWIRAPQHRDNHLSKRQIHIHLIHMVVAFTLTVVNGAGQMSLRSLCCVTMFLSYKLALTVQSIHSEYNHIAIIEILVLLIFLWKIPI